MKVLLINPPLTDPFQIPLGMPTLAGYLKANGVAVTQRDMSLEFIDFVIDKTATEHSWVTDQLRTTLQSGSFYNMRLNHLACIWLFEILALYFRGFDMDIGTPPELDPSFARLRIESEDALLHLISDKQRNPFCDFFESRLPPIVNAFSPTLIGISVSYEWQMIPALTIARILRTHRFRARICIGGPYITYARNRLLNHPGIVAAADAWVVFGGEIPTLELLRLTRKQDLHRIPSLLYAVGNEVRSTAPSTPLPADAAPAPLFASSALKSCLLPEPVLPIVATHSACPYGQCAFCSTHHAYLSRDNPKSIEQLLNELEYLNRRHGCTHFTFNDDCIPLATIVRLSHVLIAAKKRYRFFAAVRSSESIHEEDLHLMKRAGFVRLQFGFESATDRMLKRFAKGRSHADMLRILHLSRRAGISVLLSAFVGFPGERMAEANATIEFFNSQNHLFDAASIVPYSFEEGSIAWNHPDRYGISPIAGGKHDLFHDMAYATRCGVSRGSVRRLLAKKLIRSRYEPLLGTAASLLYVSKHGYSSFMNMILRVRKKGSPLHPQWQLPGKGFIGSG
jgi:anaerobic magnesium-protoporphyrin IX monomethyl ester cyclase